jgi:hypothetical protein
LQHNVDIEKEEPDASKDAALGMLWDVTPNRELKDEVTIEDHEVHVDR